LSCDFLYARSKSKIFTQRKAQSMTWSVLDNFNYVIFILYQYSLVVENVIYVNQKQMRKINLLKKWLKYLIPSRLTKELADFQYCLCQWIKDFLEISKIISRNIFKMFNACKERISKWSLFKNGEKQKYSHQISTCYDQTKRILISMHWK